MTESSFAGFLHSDLDSKIAMLRRRMRRRRRRSQILDAVLILALCLGLGFIAAAALDGPADWLLP